MTLYYEKYIIKKFKNKLFLNQAGEWSSQLFASKSSLIFSLKIVDILAADVKISLFIWELFILFFSYSKDIIVLLDKFLGTDVGDESLQTDVVPNLIFCSFFKINLMLK